MSPARTPAAARSATRRMAEINRAYEQLRIGTPGAPGRSWQRWAADAPSAWPLKPRPTRPVTARLDLSETFRPRNATTGRAPDALPGQPPLKGERFDREPPRASEPNGPLDRGWDPHFRPAPVPSVESAMAARIEFGKFHGHTLGEIAAFEPSYIDWLARTISHDPELVGRGAGPPAGAGPARRRPPSAARAHSLTPASQSPVANMDDRPSRGHGRRSLVAMRR